jgi:hypothetical protein
MIIKVCAMNKEIKLRRFTYLKRLNQKLFSAILILAKHCQKIVETSQHPLNVLPVFIITEKSFWSNLFM